MRRAQSESWAIPLGTDAPGIFTLSASGVGQGSVLNQDNSVNGPNNHAARGSVIQIFATGDGRTIPGGITGSITQHNLNKPVLPVKLLIGGIDAALPYAGSAPDAVAGLLQVNAVVPPNVMPGPAVPIVLFIGTDSSPATVTVAVK